MTLMGTARILRFVLVEQGGCERLDGIVTISTQDGVPSATAQEIASTPIRHLLFEHSCGGRMELTTLALTIGSDPMECHILFCAKCGSRSHWNGIRSTDAKMLFLTLRLHEVEMFPGIGITFDELIKAAQQ